MMVVVAMSAAGLGFAAVVVTVTPAAAEDDRSVSFDEEGSTSHPDWMRLMADDIPLSSLSIPGTHDTMANCDRNAVLGLCWNHYKTQDDTLSEQLEQGIRALDIRSDYLDDYIDFDIYHGSINTGYEFRADVLRVVIDFLEAHPTETIYLHVQRADADDDSPLGLHAVLESILSEDGDLFPGVPGTQRYRDYWFNKTTVAPTSPASLTLMAADTRLGDLRGKFVIDTPANLLPQVVQESEDECCSQDKMDKIRAHFDTIGRPNTKLYVNYISGSGWAYPPSDVADGSFYFGTGINHRVLSDLVDGEYALRVLGVVYMDFPGSALVDAVIAQNYPFVNYFRPSPDLDIGELDADISSMVDNFAYSFQDVDDPEAQSRNQKLAKAVRNATSLNVDMHVITWRSSDVELTCNAACRTPTSDRIYEMTADIHNHNVFQTRTFRSIVFSRPNGASVPNYDRTAVSQVVSNTFPTGNVFERADQMHAAVSAAFPDTTWNVVAKRGDDGLDFWAASISAWSTWETIDYNPDSEWRYLVWGYTPQPAPCADDIFEPNDSRALPATPLVNGVTISAVSCGSNLDYYAVPVTAGQEFTAEVQFANPDHDLNLFIWDAAGNYLDTTQGGFPSGTTTKAIIQTATMTGDYQVGVIPQTNIGETTYDLTVSSGFCPADDAFEPNDTQVAASPYVLGGVSGVVCAGNSDWFSLPAIAGDELNVEVLFNNADGDIDVDLLAPDGTSLAVGTSTTDNESVTATAPVTGDYAIRVYGFQSAENTYDLQASASLCPPDDAFEDNDTQAAPTPLTSGVEITAVGCDLDADWYSIPALAGELLTVDLSVENRDVAASLYDPTLVLMGATGWATGEIEMSFTAPTEGVYRLHVIGQDTTYNLTLTTSRCPSDDGYEDNDTQATAAAFPEGSTIGAFVCGGDDDWFTLPANAGEEISVTASFVHDEGDLDMTLYDPSGQPIGAASSTTDDETITETAATTGDYAVQVTGYAGAENAYALDMTSSICLPDDQHEDNDTSGTATPLLDSVPLRLAIACSGDPDWFALPVQAGEHLDVDVSVHAGTVAAALYDPGSTLLDADLTITGDQRLSTDASATGDYLLFIQGNAAAYDVTMTATSTNDTFDFPEPIAGPSAERTGDNLGYGVEPGEPDPSCVADPTENSAWWEWTAPATGPIGIDTFGSDFDTVLAIYEGTSVGSLTEVACSDDAVGGGVASDVTFTATAATTYRIQVDGDGGETGDIVLHTTGCLGITNDQFTCATPIVGNTDVSTGTNAGYTTEPGESDPPCGDFASEDSAWWQWTAPASGAVGIDTIGSDFDTVLAIYEGTSVGSLTEVACNDDGIGVGLDSVLSFDATGGTTYRFQVDGFLGSAGTIALNTCLDDALEPNDTQLAATPLTDGVVVAGSVCRNDDWFEIPAEEGESVTAVLDFVDADGDLDLRLFDPNGTQVASSESTTADTESLVSTASLSGLYRLQVYSPDDTQNDYSVSLVAACPTGPWSAGDTASLNFAIGCFNSAPAGSHVIDLTADITLDTASVLIDNNAASLTIDGAGHRVDGDETYRVFEVTGGVVVDFVAIVISGGDVTGVGGGIHNGGGVVTLTASTVSGNSASADGGGIYNIGSLTVVDSTLSGNSATSGGAIANYADASVINSTISGNSAVAGGAIVNYGNTVSVVFSTITDNTASSGAGIATRGAGAAVTEVSASVIADNNGAGPDLELVLGSADTFASGGFNVMGSTGAGVVAFTQPGDVAGQSGVGLAPLAFNGSGSTLSHALQSGSVALDHVTGTISRGVDQTVDQNGTARPVGAGKDAGAVETTCADDAFEENDLRAAATTLANDVAVDANACPGDDDWYSLPVASGQLVTVVTDFVHANGDLDIRLFDPSGAQVDVSESTSDQEAITHTAAAAGSYALQVYSFSGTENPYSVVMRADAHPLIRPFGGLADPEGDTGSQIIDLFLYLEDDTGVPYSSPTPVTVSWYTGDIPENPLVAHPGEDFVAASGTATFLPGESVTTVQVEVLGDTVYEPPLLYGEWAVWAVNSPSANAKIDLATFFGIGLLIIIDDD